MYRPHEEANLMSYVSNRIKQAKAEVVTSHRDLMSLEKYKKSSFDSIAEKNDDIHLGMRRRMQDVLSDLEIDALAFGIKNGTNSSSQA